MTFWAALLASLWVGIQTSISPCPLATNIAAVAFLSRSIGRPRRVLWMGVLYTVGRLAVYVAISVLILRILQGQLETGSAISVFLQKYGMMALGPLLILAGMLLLELLNWPGGGMDMSGLQQRAAGGGPGWALALGVLFALSFCPASAGLFFFVFLPLAAAQGSVLALPLAYGVGTALPVIVFTFVLAFAAERLGRALDALARVEKVVRLLAGLFFIVAGVYFTATRIFGVGLG